MPRTDIDDNRSLSRLQGIDLREHGDSNTALDCVNVHLNNASRLANFPPPTKVKSGVYYFACESKNPAAQEFELSLNGNFGSPAITNQESFSGGQQVKLTGSNLIGNTLVILVDGNGHCLESGLDFELSKDGDSLVLDILWSDYANYEKVVVKNAYGWATFDVDVEVRTNKTLYIGGRYKLGIDNQTRDFCIWQRSGSSWIKLAAYGSPTATPWIEGAELKDEQTDGICLTYSGEPCWAFFAAGGNLALGYASQYYGEWGQLAVNTDGVQTWGNASGEFDPREAVDTTTAYTFGTFETYRLRATGDNSLVLEMKSNSETDNYDITLTEWHYEQ